MSGQALLTPRQLEILRLVANGNTAAQIAARLRIAPDTVNSSLRLVYRALGVGDRAHAVAVALRVGLLRPGEIHVPERLSARLRPAQTHEAQGSTEARRGRRGAAADPGRGQRGPRDPNQVHQLLPEPTQNGHDMYPTLFTTPGLAAFAEDIDDERQAQLAKWGDQHHPNGTGQYPETIDADVARMACQSAAEGGYLDWLHILREEVAEAFAESDPAKLRAELIQAAAVIAAWVYDLDRRVGGEQQ